MTLILLAGCRSSVAPAPTVVAPTTAPTALNVVESPVALLPAEPAGNHDVAARLDESWLDLVWRDPEQVTDLGVAGLVPGRSDLSEQLTDVSDAYADETSKQVRAALAAVQALDTAAMSPADRLSAATLAWYLDDLVRGEPFRHHDYLISQLFTVQNALPEFFTSVQPLATATDARHFVARLGLAGAKLDQVTAALATRVEEGLLPPRFILEMALGQMREFIAPAPRQNMVYAAFAARLEDVAGLTDAERDELLAAAEQALADELYPAYRRLMAAVDAALPGASDEGGVWRLPDGAAYYAWALRHHTTTDLTPDEVHQLGLQAVATEQAGLRAALEALGYDPADLGAALGRAAADHDAFEPLRSDADRQRVLEETERLIDGAAERLRPLFPAQPATDVVVQRVPAYREGGAGAYYLLPPLDASRPGIYFVSLGGDTAVRTTRATTAYHEGVPGHHLQLAIQRAQADLPLFRRGLVFNAHAEGWALYAERLAAEEGLYAEDPLGDLGRRQMALFRAARLVVDTGLHAQRWSRAQAVDYLVTATGLPRSFAQSEVDRYIALPGQAASYYVGYQALLDQRERIRLAQGDGFQLADFHADLLRQGSLPLALLGQAWDDVGGHP